jgi:hypothetical protein
MGLSSTSSTWPCRRGKSAASGRDDPVAGSPRAASKRTTNENVDPRPGSLSSVRVPPIRSTSWREIGSPSPVPPYLRAWELSAWEKASKIRSWSAGAIPMPVSAMSKRRLVPFGLPGTAAAALTAPVVDGRSHPMNPFGRT